MTELKKMSDMVGAMLTKEEMDDFMAEADKVFMNHFHLMLKDIANK
jgi:hypothetical protein